MKHATDNFHLMFSLPTAFGKSPDLTVPGIWPLCYTWIGYQQANGSPRVLLSNSVDHGFTCAHSFIADDSNLEVITTPSRCSRVNRLLIVKHAASLFQDLEPEA